MNPIPPVMFYQVGFGWAGNEMWVAGEQQKWPKTRRTERRGGDVRGLR